MTIITYLVNFLHILKTMARTLTRLLYLNSLGVKFGPRSALTELINLTQRKLASRPIKNKRFFYPVR